MAVDHYRQHRSAAELIDMAKKRKEEEEKKRVYGPSLPSEKRGSMDPLCLLEILF